MNKMSLRGELKIGSEVSGRCGGVITSEIDGFASDHRSFGVNDLCERRRKCLLPVNARAQASIFKRLDRQLYIVKAAHCETIIDVGACYYSR